MGMVTVLARREPAGETVGDDKLLHLSGSPVDEPAISTAQSMSNLAISTQRRSWKIAAIVFAVGAIALLAVNRKASSPTTSSASITSAPLEAIEVQPASVPSARSAKFAAMKGGGCTAEPNVEPAKVEPAHVDHVDPEPVDTGDAEVAIPVEPQVAECSAPIAEPASVKTQTAKKHTKRSARTNSRSAPTPKPVRPATDI